MPHPVGVGTGQSLCPWLNSLPGPCSDTDTDTDTDTASVPPSECPSQQAAGMAAPEGRGSRGTGLVKGRRPFEATSRSSRGLLPGAITWRRSPRGPFPFDASAQTLIVLTSLSCMTGSILSSFLDMTQLATRPSEEMLKKLSSFSWSSLCQYTCTPRSPRARRSSGGDRGRADARNASERAENRDPNPGGRLSVSPHPCRDIVVGPGSGSTGATPVALSPSPSRRHAKRDVLQARRRFVLRRLAGDRTVTREMGQGNETVTCAGAAAHAKGGKGSQSPPSPCPRRERLFDWLASPADLAQSMPSEAALDEDDRESSGGGGSSGAMSGAEGGHREVDSLARLGASPNEPGTAARRQPRWTPLQQPYEFSWTSPRPSPRWVGSCWIGLE